MCHEVSQEEYKVLSNKVTQDIADAMKEVETLAAIPPTAEDYDSAHSTLAKGITALRSGDTITHARVSGVQGTVRQVKDTVERIDKRLEDNQNHTIKKGPFKGWPARYVVLGGVAIACAGLLAGTIVIIYALNHDKISALVEAAKILHGTAERKDSVFLANGREKDNDTRTP